MEHGWESKLEGNRSTFCLETGRADIVLLQSIEEEFPGLLDYLPYTPLW